MKRVTIAMAGDEPSHTFAWFSKMRGPILDPESTMILFPRLDIVIRPHITLQDQIRALTVDQIHEEIKWR